LIRLRRATLMSFAVAVIGVVAASTAWACIPGGGGGGTLAVSPERAQPGQQIAVSGQASGSGPVEIRLNSTDGPALASLVPITGSKGAEFTGTFTVPTDSRPGESVVVASQGSRTWRTTLNIRPSDGTPLPDAPAAPPIPRGSKGLSPLLLLGGGVAVIAGIVLVFTRRRTKRNRGDDHVEARPGADPVLSEVDVSL
jgi:hypothetical protein